jgi:hypothetical protein
MFFTSNGIKHATSIFACMVGLAGFPAVVHAQAVAGSNDVAGHGVAVTEARKVRPFNGIRLEAPSGDVVYTVGGAQSVSISAQKNVLPLIVTSVEGGILIIKVHGVMLPNEPVRLVMTGPSLDTLHITGSGRIEMTGAKGPAIHATLSGSGDISVAGQVDALVLDLSGSGSIKASSVKSKSVTVTLSGSGNISAQASQEARVVLSGSGNVGISGNPNVRSVEKNGAGQVSFVE